MLVLFFFLCSVYRRDLHVLAHSFPTLRASDLCVCAGMDEPATLGPFMALALLTTLYGVVIANIVASPVAARLADLSERELAWQKEVADRMAAIARRENVPTRRASIREEIGRAHV